MFSNSLRVNDRTICDPHRSLHVVRPHAKWGLPLNERTLANALSDAVYETAITGKWHLGDSIRRILPRLVALLINMDITLARSITTLNFVREHGTGTAR